MRERAIPRTAILQYARALDPLDAVVALDLEDPDHPCRSGCAYCCDGPFDVGPADVWRVVEAIAAMPEGPRRALLRRVADAAATQARHFDALGGRTVEALGDDRFDALCDTLADQRCPLHDGDGCAVYAARPQVCRMTGATFAHDDELLDVGCPVDLTEGRAALRVDLAAVELAVARVESRLDVPGVGRERTTLALALDALFRHGGTTER